MENQPPGPAPPSVAEEQLRVAGQAHDASVGRAVLPVRFILALSVLCGAQTIALGYKGPGDVVSIIGVVWFLAEPMRMSARQRWRPLRSLPKPRWGVIDVVLMAVAVLVGEVWSGLICSPAAAIRRWGAGGLVGP